MKEILFEMTEIRKEAQAVNDEAVANAAKSVNVNNVPACEGEVEDQSGVGNMAADKVSEKDEAPGVDLAQTPLMEEHVIYTLDEDTLQDLLVIKSNRKEEKQIKAKQKSCREYGMIIPGLFTDATVAHDAGYELINPRTGETVKSREETYGKTVIAEGNTRFWALLAETARIDELKRKNKCDSDDEKPFEYTFTYRHITDPKVFKNLYRHINIDNVPTRTKDFARDFLATERENKVVTSYSSKIDRGLSPKAAGFATSFKEVKKADIEALMAGKHPIPYVFRCSDQEFELAERIFKGVLEGFGIEEGTHIKNKVLKGTFIWRWISAKLERAGYSGRSYVAQKIIDLFSSMSSQDSERINNAEKTSTKTREQVIHSILNKMYSERYKNNKQ